MALSHKPKQALPGSKINAFYMDPGELTIIGLDTKDGQDHPLYDERIRLPINEALVLSIMAYGVQKPVVVHLSKDKTVAEVLDGRQRIRAAREANARKAAAGEKLIKVPVMTRKGESGRLLSLMTLMNSLNQEQTPLEKGRRALRLIEDMGEPIEDVAITFGVSVATINAWLKLVDLDPKLLNAVETGKVSANQALQVASSSPTAQRMLAAKAEKEGPAKTGRRKGSTNAVPTKQAIRKQMTKIAGKAEKGSNKALQLVALTLGWVIGEVSDEFFLKAVESD